MLPLDRFKKDRQRARDASDPAASLCVAATVDDRGQPQVRTLVLRDIDDELAIFVNATSPKWREIPNGIAILTYWPSIQVQYRLKVSTEPVPQPTVAASWALRPDPPKHMDWYYETIAEQTSVAGTRAELLANLGNVSEPLTAPTHARGLILTPHTIERLDLTQDNGIHDRVLYTCTEEGWIESTLVP